MTKQKIQTTWDLKRHFFQSSTDKAFQRDIANSKRAYRTFAKKYSKDKRYLSSPQALKVALDEYERLSLTWNSLTYLHYRLAQNTRDAEAEALAAKYGREARDSANTIVFFTLSIGKIPKKIQQKMLGDKVLEPYHYYLKQLFENAKFALSEPEEQILNLLHTPAQELWVQGVEKLETTQEVRMGNKKVPVHEALQRAAGLSKKARRNTWNETMRVLKTAVSPFAESEINALYTKKHTIDMLRGFKHPFSAKILSNENDERSVLTMVETAQKHFPLAHRFYRLKARALGLQTLAYVERATPIGKLARQFTFSQTLEILRESFGAFGSHYRTILDNMVLDGRVDIFPRVGKSGGAFCSASEGNPTFVLLNHVDDIRSLMTCAHEMGHAIHYELSKKQPLQYQSFSTAAAETASTLFEEVAFDTLYSQLSKKEQLIALHDRLSDKISTIFRQTACFLFEKELHERIRAEGFLQKEAIAQLMNKHMAAYLGPSVRLTDDDGYFFVTWSHIRNFFYVYTYVYGALVSGSLYEKYKEDSSFEKKIKIFLERGGSQSPDDIFKHVGLDTTKPSFFEAGIRKIERDLNQFEALLAKK